MVNAGDNSLERPGLRAGQEALVSERDAAEPCWELSRSGSGSKGRTEPRTGSEQLE